MAELTLPDYLRAGLDLVFVGINPGLSSAKAGHYFHSAVNRFWPAVTRAGIFDPPLSAETDSEALAQGVGFTDLVKRATPSVSGLRVADYRAGAASLKERLTTATPATCRDPSARSATPWRRAFMSNGWRHPRPSSAMMR